MAAAMLIGLTANWVRIAILVVVADVSNMEIELLTNHETIGWLVYGAFILTALKNGLAAGQALARSKRNTERLQCQLLSLLFLIGFYCLDLVAVKKIDIVMQESR